MGEFIQNRLHVSGSKKEVNTLFEYIKGSDKEGKMQIDFNKIAPMPKELDFEMHSGIEHAVEGALRLSPVRTEKWQQLDPRIPLYFDSPLMLNDGDWVKYITALHNVRKFGFINWEDWCYAHWGTRFNAHTQNDARNTKNTIYFRTKDDTPVLAIKKLSEQFSKVSLQLDYTCTTCGCYVGKISFRNGTIVSHIKVEDESKEAYEFSFELMPEERQFYREANGTYEMLLEDEDEK